MPPVLNNELRRLDGRNNLENAEHNFMSLVKSVKQHNLDHPEQAIAILTFDTNVSYAIGTSHGGMRGLEANRQRSKAVSYLACKALEEVPNDQKVIVFVGGAHIAEMEQERIKGIGEI